MGIWNAKGRWFLQLLGVRSSVGMLAAPFRPLNKSISLLSLVLFLRDSHLFQHSSPTSSFKEVIPRYKSSCPILNFFSFFLKDHSLGVPDTTTIFQDRANKSFICCFFYIYGALIKSSSQEDKCSISLCTHVANMSIPSQVMCDGPVKVFNGIHIFEDRSL